MSESAIQKTSEQAPPPTIKQMLASPIIQNRLAKLAGKHFDGDRLGQAFIIAIAKNEKLGQCRPDSLLDCLMTAAQQGWTIGGPRPGMYMVPYNGVATPIPSYYGFQQIARESEGEWELEAEVVKEGDEFRYRRGLVPMLEHVPHDEDDAEITHFYAIARSKEGRTKFDVMTLAQVEAIRQRSRAKSDGPWVTDFIEMGKKTVVRRLTKYLPASPAMDRAIELSDQDGVHVEISDPNKRMNLREQAKSLSPSPPVGAAAPSNAPTVLDSNAGSPQGAKASQETQAPVVKSAEVRPAQTTGGDGPAAKTPGGTGPSPEAGGAVGAQAAPTPPAGKEADPRTVEQKADEWAQSDPAELRKALKAARVGANRQKAWVGKACEMHNVAFIDNDVSDDVIRKVARDYLIFKLENE